MAYKLSNYVADFKTIQGKSRIEIIFLTIFFIFLFIPASHINQAKISGLEKRKLAKLQPLIKDNNEINVDFGKNFNDWFNDRFFLRDFFISASYIKYLLTKQWITRDVIKGKDEWLFLGWQISINDYSRNTVFTNDELVKLFNHVNDINNYCKKHNKKFYMVICPNKATIYGEYYTDAIKQTSNESKAEQLIKYINKHSDIKVIYPKDTLLSHKNEDLLYWKADTHWNELGAYYGYLELMKVINKDFKTIRTYKVTDYTKEQKADEDLQHMSPKILKKSDLTLYKKPKITDITSTCNKPAVLKGIVNCYNPQGSKNLLMLRDSFTNSLIPYLSYSFKNSKYMWQYDFSPTFMDNADIVIFEIVEKNLSRLLDGSTE